MTSANCPICHSSKFSKEVAVPDFEYAVPYLARYRLCGECRCYYQAPMPTSSQLASFYPAHYHSYSKNGAMDEAKNSLRFKSIRDFLTGERPVVLDYGCGGGSFLDYLARVKPGVVLYGYEIGPEDRVLRDDKKVIIQGSFQFLLSQLPDCDVMMMHHVIEHLPDPVSVLSLLKGKLKPGGYFLGQTPSNESLEHQIFQARWSNFHAPRHTVIFSPHSLKKAVAQGGLKVLSLKPAFNPASWALSFMASRQNPQRISPMKREGAGWTVLVLMGAFFQLFENAIGKPGIIDFAARNTQEKT